MKKKSAPPVAEATFESNEIAVASVVAIQTTPPLWKITSTVFDVYYTDCAIKSALAERAREEGRYLKVESDCERSGRRMLNAMMYSSDERRNENGDSKEFESPRADYLF